MKKHPGGEAAPSSIIWETALGPNRVRRGPESLEHHQSPPLPGQERSLLQRPLHTFALETSGCLSIALRKGNKWNSFLEFKW